MAVTSDQIETRPAALEETSQHYHDQDKRRPGERREASYNQYRPLPTRRGRPSLGVIGWYVVVLLCAPIIAAVAPFPLVGLIRDPGRSSSFAMKSVMLCQCLPFAKPAPSRKLCGS